MNESFESSGSSGYRPNFDRLQEDGSAHHHGALRRRQQQQFVEETPENDQNSKLSATIDAVFKRVKQRAAAEKAAQKAGSRRDTACSEATLGSRASGVVDEGRIAKSDPDQPEEEQQDTFENWSLTEMQMLLETFEVHGDCYIGHAMKALPKKTEVEIRKYFEYLSRDSSSTSSVAGVSPVQGLVYSPSLAGRIPGSSSDVSWSRRRRSGSGTQQEFGGYLESRAGSTNQSQTFRQGTERTNVKEALRRSLEDESDHAAPEPKISRNHAYDWFQIVDRLQWRRGTPCDFSESLIPALQNLATLVRQYDNKHDHVVNGILTSLSYDNLYKYIFCLLKGVEPIALTALESAILLELTEKLRARVAQTDTTEMEEYLGKIRELDGAGSLQFDADADKNLSDKAYQAKEAQPDMLSVNPLCISQNLLLPKYKKKAEGRKPVSPQKVVIS